MSDSFESAKEPIHRHQWERGIAEMGEGTMVDKAIYSENSIYHAWAGMQPAQAWYDRGHKCSLLSSQQFPSPCGRGLG
jgi:hypothetical protein